MAKHVLFLYTGNAARRRMAEGLVNRLVGEEWEAVSAGLAPAGHVHPLAMRAMAELGIDIGGQRSKSVYEFRDATLGLVVTVCDSAAESGPMWLAGGVSSARACPPPRRRRGARRSDSRCFVRGAMRSGARSSSRWGWDDGEPLGSGAT